MAVFTAYMDASGTKYAHALSVSGFVSRLDKWKRFEKEWGEILKSEGISIFHMADFVSSKGEFSGWKGPEHTDRRRKFLDRLIVCAKNNTNRGFAVSVVIKDYNEVNRDYMVNEALGPPYSLAGLGCIAMLGKWAEKKGVAKERILVMIEDGDDDQPDFKGRCRAIGIKAVPLSKQDAHAFQVADIAGWKSRTAIQEALVKNITTESEAANVFKSLRLVTPIMQTAKVIDKHALLKMCMKGRVPKRERGLIAI